MQHLHAALSSVACLNIAAIQAFTACWDATQKSAGKRSSLQDTAWDKLWQIIAGKFLLICEILNYYLLRAPYELIPEL